MVGSKICRSAHRCSACPFSLLNLQLAIAREGFRYRRMRSTFVSCGILIFRLTSERVSPYHRSIQGAERHRFDALEKSWGSNDLLKIRRSGRERMIGPCNKRPYRSIAASTSSDMIPLKTPATRRERGFLLSLETTTTSSFFRILTFPMVSSADPGAWPSYGRSSQQSS